MGQIQYRYALFGSQVVDINVPLQVPGPFYCLSCGTELIPVLNGSRQKHFRHASDTDRACSPETYLHKLAKKRFIEIYRRHLLNNVPFLLEVQTPEICSACSLSSSPTKFCPVGLLTLQYDLAKKFPIVEEESFDVETGLRPDITLRSVDGTLLYIEIAVTHFASERKILSKRPIVEISINNENDVDSFRIGIISVNDTTIKAYNLDPDPALADYSNRCTHRTRLTTDFLTSADSTQLLNSCRYEMYDRYGVSVFLPFIPYDQRSFVFEKYIEAFTKLLNRPFCRFFIDSTHTFSTLDSLAIPDPLNTYADSVHVRSFQRAS